MKRKWDQRIYIDPFCGERSRENRGNKSNSFSVASPCDRDSGRFTRYVFCEKNAEKMEALRTRISRDYQEVDARFVADDANTSIEEILGHFPTPSRETRTLAFCFVDPYSLGNLKFETIRGLSSRHMDFLILIPTEMDANRNMLRYCQPNNRTLDIFFGTEEWRITWKESELKGERFWGFILRFYAEQMQRLRYLDQAAEQAELIRSMEKNLPLYRLALFSRNKLGGQFWSEVRKYANPQTSFPF